MQPLEIRQRVCCNYCFHTLDPSTRDPVLQSFVQCVNCGQILHHACYLKYPRCHACGGEQFQFISLANTVPVIQIYSRDPIDVRGIYSQDNGIKRVIPALVAGGVLFLIAGTLGIMALRPSPSSGSAVQVLTVAPTLPVTAVINAQFELVTGVPATPTSASTLTQVLTNTPVPTNTTAPTNTPVPTNTTAPTNTLIPTNKPRPTNTNLPTRTSQPRIPRQSSSDLRGTVTANRLNLRSGPGPEYNDLGTLSKGNSVTLIGRNEQATWGQIVGGEWVNLDYINFSGRIRDLPVTFVEIGGWGTAGRDIGVRGRADAVLRIRGGPGVDYSQLSNPDTVREGDTMTVVGRSGDGAWFQINVNGRSGWVNANYVTITSGRERDLPIVR